jgi:hypothetical protein
LRKVLPDNSCPKAFEIKRNYLWIIRNKKQNINEPSHKILFKNQCRLLKAIFSLFEEGLREMKVINTS